MNVQFVEIPARGEASQRVRFTALVVVQEPSLRRVIVGQLARAGYCVCEAGDGLSGIERARSTLPDIVVVDSGLPNMHGIEFCRRLRDVHSGSDPFVLLILGPEDEERLFEAFEAGMDDYVTRPLHPWALLSRVAAGERILRLTSTRFMRLPGSRPRDGLDQRPIAHGPGVARHEASGGSF